jgi:hypothetical protein
MRNAQIDGWALMFLLGFGALAMYGFIQGLRVWRDPNQWRSLRLHWYSDFGKLFVHREQREMVDDAWTDDRTIRWLAGATMILCAIGLAIIVVVFLV